MLLLSKIEEGCKKIGSYLNNEKLCLLLIAIFYLFQAPQGFENTDEGWSMNAFQQIFHAPATQEYYFMYYLTGIVGGIWNLFFGWGGYISFRILEILFFLAMYSTLYRILRNYTKSTFWIFVGFLLATSDHFLVSLNCEPVVGLLSLFVCTALLKGYQGSKLSIKGILLASYLVGFAAFARITDICLIGVVGVAILSVSIYHKSLNLFFRYLFSAIVGLGLGILSVLGFMYIMGHLDIFMACMKNNVLSLASSNTSSHGIGNELKYYASEYFNIILIGLMLIQACITSCYILNTDNRFLRWIVPSYILEICTIVYACGLTIIGVPLLLFATVRFALCYIKVRDVHALLSLVGMLAVEILFLRVRFSSDLVGGIMVIYAVSFIISAISLYKYRKDFRLVYTFCIAISLSMLYSVGSDYGLRNGGYMSVSFLFSLCLILSVKIIDELPQLALRQFFKCSGLLAILLCGGYSVFYRLPSNAFGDPGSRFEKRYRIKESDLATTFTTKEKAASMDELLIQLKPYVHEGDYTLFFHELPIVHYLTHTLPYTNNSWPYLYEPEIFRYQLQLAERTRKELPVIVCERSVYDEWISGDKTSASVIRMNDVQEFIQRHSYKMIWETEEYMLYIPYSLLHDEL
jgi:hypothetical protein